MSHLISSPTVLCAVVVFDLIDSSIANVAATQQVGKLVRAGLDLSAEVDVALIGHQVDDDLTQSIAALAGVNKVLVVEDESMISNLADQVAPMMVELSSNYSHVLMAADSDGKDLLPRCAALLGVGMFSDVVAIDSADTVTRTMYAGNVLAQVKTTDPIVLMTVRTSVFSCVVSSTEQSASIEKSTIKAAKTGSKRIQLVVSKTERPSLTQAKAVVSGGRGLGSQENFAMIEALADKLGAAVGASRAAVDAGFISNDYQVGQTGKIVAPELYIAVGLSGAIQHVAGMKDSKVVVAINQDPDAPIFDVSDYGMVGDLFEIVPELIDKL